MPLFDEELLRDLRSPGNLPRINSYLSSPYSSEIRTPSVPSMFGGYADRSSTKGGISLEEIKQLSSIPKRDFGFGAPSQFVFQGELNSAARRYNFYDRDVDLEDIHALNQGPFDKLTNGILKGLGIMGGTFLQGFASIPHAISAVRKGSFDELSTQYGWEKEISDNIKQWEDALPNYVDKWEREHPLAGIVPLTRGSANFWGDGVFKNLGFGIGAITNAIVTDVAITYATGGSATIPVVGAQLAKLGAGVTSALGKASVYLSRIATGTSRMDDVLNTARLLNKTPNQLATLRGLAYAAAGTKVTSGARWGMGIFNSSRTEAAIEAADGENAIIEYLINDYKIKNNGEAPVGADLEDIKKIAADARNARFGINMALLTASTAVQFGSLFRAFTAAAVTRATARAAARGIAIGPGGVRLAEGSLDVFERQVAKGLAPRVWDYIKPTAKNMFMEGVFEEGGQFAAEKGTFDYYTRKYKNLKDGGNLDNWRTTNEIMTSTIEGLSEQFTSTEGIKNMVIGAISSVIMGGLSNRVQRAMGVPSEQQRLQSAINILNRYGLTGMLQNQYSDTLNALGIAKEMQDAIDSGNVFKYKNLKHDMFFNLVNSRAINGLHDVTIEQLKMLKDLDEAEFTKTFGMDFSETNKKTVSSYVDSLINKANEMNRSIVAINDTFRNPYTSYDDPQTEEQILENFKHDTVNEWKTNLAYYSTVAYDVNGRLENIQQDLSNINPLLTTSMISSLTSREEIKELANSYEEKAKSLGETITEYTTPADKKAIRNQIKTLRTLSERINLALSNGTLDMKTFETLLNFEVSGQQSVDDKVLPMDKIGDIYKLSEDINRLVQLREDASNSFDNLVSEEGFDKFFKQAEEMGKEQEEVIDGKEKKEEEEEDKPFERPLEFLNKSGVRELPQVEREYQLEKLEPAKVKKIADDRYEVTSPYGEVTFYPNKEEADEAVEEMNADLEALKKVKILALNEDGTIKVEDASGNIQNIDPKKLTGYEKIQSAQEKLIEKKETLEAQQTQIENNSGTVTTIDSSLEFGEREPAKREVSVLFTGGITESETYADPTKSAPHVIRSRRFLNIVKNNRNRGNVKAILVTPNQEASLGLTGLSALSYKVDTTKMTPEELKEFNATIRKPDTGFVAQVFVVQKGNKLFFADEAGNPMNEVGTQVDLNRVVFQTMPTPALYDSQNNPRFRSNQEAEAKAYSEAWAKYREQLMTAPETAFTIYDFRISRGIPIVKEVPAVDSDGNPILNAEGKPLMDYEKNHVGDVLAPEDKINNSNGLIVVSITGEIVHNGLPINVLRGTPVLQYGDTLQVLNNRRFTKSEARVIFRLLSELSKGFALNSNLEESYVNFLQNVLHWKQGKNPSKNQVYINPNTMELRIAGKDIPLSEVAEREGEIMDELQKTFSNVNNKTIKSDYPFTEYFINEENAIESREWPNYQSYLLSANYPDGAKRSINETPLYTSVAKPTPAQPYSYMQKYATLEGLELDVQYTAPVQKAEAEGKLIVDGYVIDNETPNTFPLRKELGGFQFKANQLPNGKIEVELLDTEDTKSVVGKIASNADLMNNEIVPKLKLSKLYDPIKDVAKSNEDLAGDYLANLAAVTIESKMNAKPAEPVAAEPTPTPAAAPVSNKVQEARNKLKEIWNNIGNNKGRSALEDGWAESFGYLNDALSAGSQNYQAHGMGKSGFPAALRDLFELFDKGIDSSRGGGQLYTAPLGISEEDKAAASAIGTAGGTAYTDGAFVLVAKQGVVGIRSIDDIAGILVNSGLTDINPEILTELRKAFPNLVIESYKNTKGLVEQLNQSVKPVSTDAKADIEKQLVIDGITPEYGSPRPAINTFVEKTVDKDGNVVEGKTYVGDEEIAKAQAMGVTGAFGTKSSSIRTSTKSVKIGSKQYRATTVLYPDGKASYQLSELDASGIPVKTLTESEYRKELAALEGAKPTAPVVTKFSTSTPEQSVAKITPLISSLNQLEININKALSDENAKQKVKEIIDNYNKSLPTVNGWKLVAEINEGSLDKLIKAPANERAQYGISVNFFITPANNPNYRTGGKKAYNALFSSRSLSNAQVQLLGNKQLTEEQYKEIADSVLNRYKVVSDAIAKEGGIATPNIESLDDLFVLGKAKPAEPTTPYNNEGTTGPSTEFRLIAKGEKKQDRIDDLDLAEFKKWAAEKVPGIPYEVLDNIIRANPDVTAWGAFENGVAKFYRSATRGTEYHEIFEGIWKGFLSPGEREAILNEFRSQNGTFLDRASGRQIEYAAATDREAKERIADDFGDFRVGKLPARSLKELILRFFRSIVNFFKNFNNKPTLKDQLFEQIELGRFKESTLPDTIKNDFAEYKEIEGLSERQAAQFVEDMTARVAGLIFLKAKRFLYSPERATSKQIFDEVEQMYLREGESKGWNGVNKRTKLGDYRWNALVQRTKEKLRTLGVDFNQEDRLSLNDENTNKNDYAPEAFTVDVKKTASFDVKFTLATLYKAKAMDQSNSLGLQMPDAEISTEALGYKLLNFSTAFATILDKLSNTSDVNGMVNKLSELASNDADYVRMFKRLGGELKDKSMPYGNFKAEDWRFFISFFQTFTKQKPDAVVQRVAGRETFTTSANIQTAARQQVNSWVTNMKVLSRTSKGAIFYDSKTETYKANIDKLKEMPIGTPKQMIEFLDQIGITFDNETYKKLKGYGGDRSQKSQFANAVKDIRTFLQKTPDILTVTSQTLGITPQLNTLGRLYVNANNPNQDITYFGIERKRMQAFVDNNTASVFENEFNESATLDELLEKRPELKDIFSTNSQILKKGGLYFDKEGNRIRDIKVMAIQGIDDMDSAESKSISKLSLGERFSLEINQNLNGDYYVLIPADSSTEWMMNIGNQISYQEFVDGKAWGKIYKIYKGYLMDDIMLARDYKERGKLNNVKARAKELRFFNDILRPSLLEKVNGMVVDKSVSMEEIEKFVNENEKLINQDVALFLNNIVDKSFDILKQNGQLIAAEGGYTWQSLDNTFARDNSINKNNDIIEEVVKQILLFGRANYTINNIEYHKMIFGDPLQFSTEKGKFDETKRIKSFLSPRRTTFDMVEFDNFLNDNMNEVAGMMLKPGDPGYHKHKRYTRTVTLKDPIVASALANTMEAYDGSKEADAASWLMDNTFREIKLKNGQWSDEAEDFHQWQMAYTRKQLAAKGKYVYSNPELQAYDAKLTASKSPRYVLEVLKPIVSGVKYNTNSINLVLDKFSQMPIYYSMVEGTNLEELYLQMMEQGYGYAIVESGRKVGAEGLQPIYNSNGTFNKEAFNNKVDVPWKAYGIQVENIYDEGKEQTRGSQLTKLVSLDLFANGEVFGATGARAEYIKNLYKRNVADLDRLHANAYKRLLNKLGIVDNGQGFELEDKQALSTVLVYEMFRRELSENAKDTARLDENKQFRIPFEASPSYVQIRNIVFAMIDKSINSPKMGGRPKVQTPVTMWESAKEGRTLLQKTKDGYKKISREQYEALSENEKKTVRLGSDTLKFYTKDKPYMEVMLPHWFKDKLANKKFKTDKEMLDYINNSPDGKKILRGIGFRIPTQALSSIDVFVVKGFLPAYMGDTVVVPTEIVTKAGSDFDIDKLNTYLRNIYIDATGNIRLVKYKGSEEATKEFFTKVYNDTIQVEIDKIEKFEGFRDRLFSVLLDLEGISDFSQESVNAAINENDIDFFYDHINLIKEIINQAAENNIDASEYIAQQVENLADKKTKLTKKLLSEQLKTEFVEDMYNRSLQNEYYDSLEEIITLPENFMRLITPVGDGGLKKIADELDNLTGDREADVKNKILDPNYITTLRNSFVVGKAWVGIGAVNITNQSLTQKTQTYIDPEKIKNVSEFDQKFLEDGTILLPHNKVVINGQERISLSGVMDANNELYISDGLSGYITSFVDVSKDPYIMKIIRSNKVVGTFMFMQRIGIPIRTAALFMNQPIITEYIKLVEGRGSLGLFSSKNIKDILNRFPVKDKTTAEVAEAINLDNLAENISEFAKNREFSNLKKNAEQVLIFNQFLRLAKMAQYNFKFTQAINYDTTKFKSADAFGKKVFKTEMAAEENIITSVEDVLSNSHIGQQKKTLELSIDATGAIFVLDQERFKAITDKVLDNYKQRDFISEDDYDRVSNKVRASFLDYIIQTQTGLNAAIKPLLIDANTSIATRLAEAKRLYSNELPILPQLDVRFDRENGIHTVTLMANVKDAASENMYIGMMRELRNNPKTNQLYKDLVTLSILQGTYQTAVSIKNIIPIEDYSAIVSPIMTGLVVTKDMDAFADGMFQRNNWNDDKIVTPLGQVFFITTTQQPIYNDIAGNAVYEYYSPMFPKIESLGIQPLQRKVLYLDENYNNDVIQSGDYIKIRRVVANKNGGELVDVVKGVGISSKAYALMKKAGNPIISQVIGYQKVKYPDGTPLTIGVKNYKGEVETKYVYKLINLYGEGAFGSEYYTDFRPSVVENNTVRIKNEIPDNDIISALSQDIKVDDVVEQAPTPVTSGKVSGINTPSGKLKLRDGKEYNISDINSELLEKLGYKPKEIGKLLKLIC